MPARPLAVLDANCLYPFQLRNVLLHLAEAGLFDPLWSAEILDEAIRNLISDGAMDRERAARLTGRMTEAFPGALGAGYEHAADGIALPDPTDRHVLALALRYEADVIVTINLKHFPRPVLDPVGLAAIGPDDFLARLADLDFRGCFRACETHRLSLKSAPLDPVAYIESLSRRARVPKFASRLVGAGFVHRARPLPP